MRLLAEALYGAVGWYAIRTGFDPGRPLAYTSVLSLILGLLMWTMVALLIRRHIREEERKNVAAA